MGSTITLIGIVPLIAIFNERLELPGEASTEGLTLFSSFQPSPMLVKHTQGHGQEVEDDLHAPQ